MIMGCMGMEWIDPVLSFGKEEVIRVRRKGWDREESLWERIGCMWKGDLQRYARIERHDVSDVTFVFDFQSALIDAGRPGPRARRRRLGLRAEARARK